MLLPFWAFPAIGATLGLIGNRRNPIGGALTGGLLGAGGGWAAEALAPAAAGAGAIGQAIPQSLLYSSTVPAAEAGLFGTITGGATKGAAMSPMMKYILLSQGLQAAGGLLGDDSGLRGNAPAFVTRADSSNDLLDQLYNRKRRGILA